MAWLLIDTSDRQHIRLAEFSTDRDSVNETIIPGARGRFVAELASRISLKTFAGLSGLFVVEGPGPFSSIRSGVLVANLLSRLYHVPLYGVSVEQARDVQALRAGACAGAFKTSTYVAPVYDAEPNITCK